MMLPTGAAEAGRLLPAAREDALRAAMSRSTFTLSFRGSLIDVHIGANKRVL
jgi:hypothetical protein